MKPLSLWPGRWKGCTRIVNSPRRRGKRDGRVRNKSIAGITWVNGF
jgi:hypothetical protein